ncbi:PP2C family protein-serine/threonine phosphatase [Luteimonas huabeiensis]|uniref:PP2C family protein-serine/threonine phosphatase n=1 Tax=Luteimonas huabeiensis TaxID=1244513 RepID=UPI0004664EA8|nr:protein phosphatase 2C domain-containing protein [Luteimonas huabeiensis]
MSAGRWHSFGRTETGKVRRCNEDAILLRDDAGLWAVADGLGGHSAGDYASRLIVERLAAVPRAGDLCDFVDAIEDALEAVNAELLRVAAERGLDLIGSTVVVLVRGTEFVLCGWVGDSRGYCVDGRRLRQITEDHVHGQKDDATRYAGAAAPPPGALTRAVGAQPQLFVDWTLVDSRRGGRFVLCTDGINKEIGDEELDRECLRARDPQALVTRLFELALARAARDNVTAVAVQAQESPK